MSEKPILQIAVEREDITGAYFASWDSTDGSGVSGYSSTPIGAVANLLCVLILVLEDRARSGESVSLIGSVSPLLAQER